MLPERSTLLLSSSLVLSAMVEIRVIVGVVEAMSEAKCLRVWPLRESEKKPDIKILTLQIKFPNIINTLIKRKKKKKKSMPEARHTNIFFSFHNVLYFQINIKQKSGRGGVNHFALHTREV